MTFQKGQSGNPASRPVGAPGRASVPAQALFEGEAQARPRLVRQARASEPGGSAGQCGPVAVVGCITFFTTYSPIWRPVAVPTRVENR